MQEITRRLRVLRAGRVINGRPLTQREVARRSGLSLSRYWEIELGYRQPTSSELASIARVLDCSRDDIVPSAEQVAAS